jgi:hypothetical protein
MPNGRDPVPPYPAGSIRYERVSVIGAPPDEFLVFRQHGVDHLVQYVVGGLSKERRVRVQRFAVLSIKSRDMAKDLLSSGPWFDERHSTPLLTQERGFEVRPKVTHLARRSAV